ncbi:hypothetical protein BGZ76_001750 [Entomortierella beljakovae]|nr:hypothetical protein BGZ76_001750 [Entomortierella beljakovae]
MSNAIEKESFVKQMATSSYIQYSSQDRYDVPTLAKTSTLFQTAVEAIIQDSATMLFNLSFYIRDYEATKLNPKLRYAQLKFEPHVNLPQDAVYRIQRVIQTAIHDEVLETKKQAIETIAKSIISELHKEKEKHAHDIFLHLIALDDIAKDGKQHLRFIILSAMDTIILNVICIMDYSKKSIISFNTIEQCHELLRTVKTTACRYLEAQIWSPDMRSTILSKEEDNPGDKNKEQMSVLDTTDMPILDDEALNAIFEEEVEAEGSQNNDGGECSSIRVQEMSPEL